MPVHDWNRVDANLFHHFHQRWTISICDALNEGLLPPGFDALIEQRAARFEPDVLAVHTGKDRREPQGGAITAALPKTRLKFESEGATQLGKANRIAIRHQLGEVVCMIELVSPGNKSSKKELTRFVRKTKEFLDAGVNVLVIDLFPPTRLDPGGIHKAIWDKLDGKRPFALPPDEPLTLAAYVAGDRMGSVPIHAYVEPQGVGRPMPDMPAFLDADHHVPVPLERTYQESWNKCPQGMRRVVERGPTSDEGEV